MRIHSTVVQTCISFPIESCHPAFWPRIHKPVYRQTSQFRLTTTFPGEAKFDVMQTAWDFVCQPTTHCWSEQRIQQWVVDGVDWSILLIQTPIKFTGRWIANYEHKNIGQLTVHKQNTITVIYMQLWLRVGYGKDEIVSFDAPGRSWYGYPRRSDRNCILQLYKSREQLPAVFFLKWFSKHQINIFLLCLGVTYLLPPSLYTTPEFWMVGSGGETLVTCHVRFIEFYLTGSILL